MGMMPIWANAGTVRNLPGVCDKLLMSLVIKGVVDMRKLGDRKQSATVYRLQQVLDWIEGKPNPKKRVDDDDFDEEDFE